MFAYIYHKNQPNVGIYTIHGSYGIYQMYSTSIQYLYSTGVWKCVLMHVHIRQEPFPPTHLPKTFISFLHVTSIYIKCTKKNPHPRGHPAFVSMARAHTASKPKNPKNESVAPRKMPTRPACSRGERQSAKKCSRQVRSFLTKMF